MASFSHAPPLNSNQTMGKSKRPNQNRPSHQPYKTNLNHHPKSQSQRTIKRTSNPIKKPPTIPFAPHNRILLAGEGDFSFAHSLYSHHNCTSLVATCFDTAATLAEKYPQSTTYIRDLEDAAARGDDDDDDDEDVVDIKIVYGVDATKLGKGGSAAAGGKIVKKGGFDRVVFNFPHVGGVTKDVNRQVRYNQELLVNFFKASIPLLAPAGTIIVTIFEGEPYSLWNIRDLARHVGLQVGRSFKFQWDAYPGYRHARTLGNIDGGGGWKGEDRDARTYIFERKDAEATHTQQTKKRKSESSESDGDD